MCLLAVPYKWWVVKGGWKVKILNDGSFIFGPFLVGTLWIFHLTFGNLKRYFGVNLIMDTLFSFPLSYLFQKLKLFKLVNFRPKHIFFSFITFSLIIYGYEVLKKELNNAILFHSDVRLTLDTYSHLLPNMQKEVVGKLSKAVYG